MYMPSSPGRTPPGSRRGFTLVELLIALTVTAAIMAIALPKLGPMRDSSGVRTSKQALSAYLTTARQAAIRRGSSATFNMDGSTIWVGAPGVAQDLEPRVDLAERNGVTVELSAPLTSVSFNARGMADPRLTGPVVVRISRGSSTDSLCITLLGMIGKCGL